MTYNLTTAQARRFLLRLHGLIGEPRFVGRQGILDFVTQAGCIQFDPIDACGQNAQLVLQSRVEGFTKPMLDDLLYKDRLLVDFFDKQLAIWPTEHWPYFARQRARYGEYGRSKAEVAAASQQVLAHIAEHGPSNSKDLGMDKKVDWYWSATRLSRATLETLYFQGKLVIHHKKGTLKYYDLAERHLPAALLEAGDPHADDWTCIKWHVLRRVGSVGLQQARRSDAFLAVKDVEHGGIKKAMLELYAAGKLVKVQIEGIAEPYYAAARDTALIEEVLAGAQYKPRCAFIAPLDNLIWDRKLLRQVFSFDYTWEIYVPAAKRRYGYYTLPVVYGERFVGRIEPVRGKDDVLEIRGLWLEDGVKPTKVLMSAIDRAAKRLAKINGCKETQYREEVRV